MFDKFICLNLIYPFLFKMTKAATEMVTRKIPNANPTAKPEKYRKSKSMSYLKKRFKESKVYYIL